MRPRNVQRTQPDQAPVFDLPERLVFREHDPDRLHQRLSKIVPHNPQIEALIAGTAGVLGELSDKQRRAVIGLTTPPTQISLETQFGSLDFIDVADLQLAYAASRAVAKVLTDQGSAMGTGFMVSPRLFLTCHHVMNQTQALGFTAEFNFEEDAFDRMLPPSRFAFAPEVFFFTSPVEQLDFSLVAVGARRSGESELEHFGYCPLSNSSGKHAVGDPVNIVQHPEGRPKQIAMRGNRILARGQQGMALFYGTDTLSGSSGSPVFNDQYELVALHHAGKPYRESLDEQGRVVGSDTNEGIRISAIVAHLKQALPHFDPPKQALLSEALQQPFTMPSLIALSPHNPPMIATGGSHA